MTMLADAPTMTTRSIRLELTAERLMNELVYLLEAFPELDPASEVYDESVSGADVVHYLAERAGKIRTMLDYIEKGE